MCFAGERRSDRTSTIWIVFYLFGSIAGFRPSLRWLRSSGRRPSFAGAVLGFGRIGAGDPAKIRHFLQARGRRVYQCCVPKSMRSLHPLRNIDHRFDRHSGECRYINLEGRFPLPPLLCSLCPTFFSPRIYYLPNKPFPCALCVETTRSGALVCAGPSSWGLAST
jgi:hypothetical protein